MKIASVETFVVDAGWRPWQFVAVRTDAGLTGYGECSDGRNPYGVVGTVRDFERRPARAGSAARRARSTGTCTAWRARAPGGIAAKAIAGIELRALGHQGQGARRAGLRAASAARCASGSASTGRTAAPRAPATAS